MTWQKWVLIALYSLTALANVATIGKPRKVLTPGVVAISLLVSAAAVWLVVTA